MGISVSILTATDGQIGAFAADVAALETLFIGVINNPRACHLHDFWDGLHFVLAAETGNALPLAAVKQGDLHYRGVDDSMHALFAATTAALAEALSALSEPCCAPASMLRRCAAATERWSIRAGSGLRAARRLSFASRWATSTACVTTPPRRRGPAMVWCSPVTRIGDHPASRVQRISGWSRNAKRSR